MKQVESVSESPCETQPLPTFEKFGPPAQGITKSPHTSFLVAQYVHLQKQLNKKQTHLLTKTKASTQKQKAQKPNA